MRKKISEQIIKKLFGLSGNLCAFPDCHQNLIDDAGNIIGQICHIEAANPGGERYNDSLSDELINSFENLILLCANHHIITNDVNKYDVEKLKLMKSIHEAKFINSKYPINDELIRQLIEKDYFIQSNYYNNCGTQVIQQINQPTIYENNALTIDETKKLFNLLFENNFPKIQKIAQEEAEKRINTFINIFYNNAHKTFSSDDIIEFQDPDLQYIINQAINSAARSSEELLYNRLSKLIINRVKSRDNKLDKILLNESISIVNKLTPNQFDILALNYLIRHYNDKTTNWIDYNAFINVYVKPFLNFKNDYIDFKHLEYLSCISMVTLGTFPVSETIREHHPQLFTMPGKSNEIIKNNLDLGNILINKWDNSEICKVILTSVGFVLAENHIETKLSFKL